MKYWLLPIITLSAALLTFAQKAEPVLATATGFAFSANDLSPEGRKLFDQQTTLIAGHRKSIFDQWIFDQLLETEAKARGTTAEKIKAEATAKAPPATEAQIKAVYDANRQSIGDRPIDALRPQIIHFLKHESDSKQLSLLKASLKTSHKFVPGKDINAADLKDAEIVASIGTRNITAGEFAAASKFQIGNYRWFLYEQIKADLESSIFSKLVDAEAKKRNIDASGVIATEITNKMKEYTDYERMYLEDSLQSRLFTQYSVKFALDEPEKVVLSVSVDDDPFIGPANAKVTVVAFVDFQCSACAAFSPLLKQVVAEFGSNARLVVRDFPLDMHENGMQAALAGYAAREQGKFFEMADLMYRNQSALEAGSLRGYAKQLGMDMAKFDADQKSPAAAAEIKKDIEDGKAYGVSGTPTIFVNGTKVHLMSTARVREAIQQALK